MSAPARAYAGFDPHSPLGPFAIDRRDPGPSDVQFDILFCGVCHSDLHTVRGEWKGTIYPCVPGHEIVGRVTAVGKAVRGFRVGDLAAVGCMVDSCRTCTSCRAGEEHLCDADAVVYTYNSPDKHRASPVTYGGYSSHIVVDEAFCLHISEKLQAAAVAPLLCAGVTTWSPLKHWGAGPGKKIGVVGLGGLGHMGVKFSHAFGAETVLFTTTAAKLEDARRLGADDAVLSTNRDEMKRHTDSFDLILSTVATSHNLDTYTSLLRRDGTLVLVGIPEQPHLSPSVGKLIHRRRSIAGSAIGGIRETQEMLDYCAECEIVSDVELIPIQEINTGYQRMLTSDVKYRFVIDMESLGD